MLSAASICLRSAPGHRRVLVGDLQRPKHPDNAKTWTDGHAHRTRAGKRHAGRRRRFRRRQVDGFSPAMGGEASLLIFPTAQLARRRIGTSPPGLAVVDRRIRTGREVRTSHGPLPPQSAMTLWARARTRAVLWRDTPACGRHPRCFKTVKPTRRTERDSSEPRYDVRWSHAGAGSGSTRITTASHTAADHHAM